jgi:hypothetical protein
MQNSQSLQSAYYQEWAFVYGRKFLLTILALGSVLVTHMIGSHIGVLLFPTLFLPQLCVRVFFVAMGWAAIDWVLANALASASNVDEETEGKDGKKQKTGKRSVWVFAIAALASTLALSIVSNYFISNQLAGKTHLSGFNQMVAKSMAQDSSLKAKAFSILEDAPKVQNKLVTDALAQKASLVAQAISKGSTSWKNDYLRDKNNRDKGFFWKCRRCPEKYKAYRRAIIAAEEEGEKIVAAARNHQLTVQQSLTPTLSYQLANDSLLLAVKENTEQLEQERKDRESQINTILLCMTLGCGVLSLILTYVLREHRKRYGQQVIENNVRLFMVMFDVFARLGNGLMDIIYTVIVQPFNFLQKKGWIKRYRLSPNRLTDKPETVTDSGTVNELTDKRLCLNCSTDISHKRKGAKYCSDSCRMEHHNFVPHKRNLAEA